MKYFEGYYIKCANKDEVVSFIFGRQICKNERSAFIQVLTKENSYYETLDYVEFFKYKKLMYEQKMILNVDGEKLKINGKIDFGKFEKIKYNAMGPLKFLPFMQCRHTVVSMNHSLCGQVSINGKSYNFDGGKGYIEGDRGRSFPQKYFWAQCDGIFVSAATIPYLGIKFKGTVSILHFLGKEYRLATYLGAKVKELSEKKLFIKQWRRKLEIEVLDNKKGQPLPAPENGEMTRVIEESLERTLRFKFTIGKKVVVDFVNSHTAFEYSDNSF